MSLQLFAISRAVYEGVYPQHEVWVLLPNGMIFGQLLSKFDKTPTTNNPAEQDLSEAEKSDQEKKAIWVKDFLRENFPEATDERCITLIHAKFDNGEQTHEFPLCHITRPDKIIAWGPGSLQGDSSDNST